MRKISKAKPTAKSAAKEQKKIMPKNHRIHTMKRISTTVEEILVKGSSMTNKQNRTVIRYLCICKEEDIFYRQTDHSFIVNEYTKPVKK